MRAYELMKLVAENPQEYEGKKYNIVCGWAINANGERLSAVEVKNGIISDAHGPFDDMRYRAYLSDKTELEEIPQPVDFITAVKSCKQIKPVGNNWLYTGAWYWLHMMSTLPESEMRDLIIGDWFIEPEGVGK